MPDGESTEKKERPLWKKWLFRILFWGFIIFALIKWPQGVGAVLAGGAILVLILYLWIMHKIKKFISTFAANFQMLSPTITLVKQEKASFNNPAAVKENLAALRAAGFREVGVFNIKEVEKANVCGFIDEGRSIYAAVYDFPQLEVVVDFVTPYQDESVFTCTNTKYSKYTDGFERPPGKVVLLREEMPASELLGEFLRNRPEKPMQPIRAADFVPAVERYHKETMEWRAQQAENAERLGEELRDEFLAQANWSALEWDKKRDRLVIIYDEMPTMEVVNTYLQALPEHDEEDSENPRTRKELVVQETSRMAAFERLVQANPEAGFEKVMELSSPVPAVVYLAPERPEEEEVEEEEDE
jgi:hypothetical protein